MSHFNFDRHIPSPPNYRLVVGLTMVVVIFKEKVFVGTVSSKGDAGDTKSREEALETVPSGEGSGVSPDLAVGVS